MSDEAPAASREKEARLEGEALREAFLNQRESGVILRARDAARALGVSECELVACREGDGVARLDGDFADILRALPAVGEVMVLTRNEHCVHEKHGAFDNVHIGPGQALVVNDEVDLRLSMGHWRYGFLITEEAPTGVHTSLQFFDLDGTAVHKIYVTEETNRAAFDAIVERFKSKKPLPPLAILPPPPKKPERPDAEIDAALFLAHWAALQDTNDFVPLIQDFGLSHLQAMRLAEGRFAHRAEPASLRLMLKAAAETQTPIICFVGNPGCIQGHTGPIETVKATGPWFNILDPRFNLHLREDAIAEAWVAKKPTKDGIVTSLELFDADGFCFVLFFGKRKSGQAELESWRSIIASLPRHS